MELGRVMSLSGMYVALSAALIYDKKKVASQSMKLLVSSILKK